MTVGAIILAAGRSSRMAPRNKLLEAVGERSVIFRVTEAAIASGADPVVVVTGFDAERIAEALRGLEVALIHNPDFKEGLSTSLYAGLAALPDVDGALVLLGDMPFVETSDLAALMAAFATKGRAAICVPVHHGKRGNPVLWGAAYFPEMMRLTGDTGAKRLLEVHREHVTEVEASSAGIFADLDTLADFAHLKTRPDG